MAIAISGKQSTLPIGSIQAFGGTVAPEGWLMCDGSSQLRTTYPKLFAVIGTAYGSADGTHFNLPDLRGKFLRGVAHGQSSDPDRASRTASATGGNTGDNVGSVQTDAMQGHKHNFRENYGTPASGAGSVDYLNNAASNSKLLSGVDVPVTDGTNGTPRTTSETRPTNVNVEYIIKYDHVVNNYVADSKAMCKAWVAFDGKTGLTATILSSFNVTSVVRNSTGDYTVTITNPMSNSNYAIVTGFGISDQFGSTGEYNATIKLDTTRTTTQFCIQSFNYEPSGTTTAYDSYYLTAMVFGT